MIARIRQRDLTDCGICSLAMFLDKTYEEIHADVMSYYRTIGEKVFCGIDAESEIAVLWKHGAMISTHEGRIEGYLKGGRWLFTRQNPKDFKKLFVGKKAIISVPSLNFEGKGHAIFWDGGQLHDPSNLKRYTSDRAFRRAFRVIVDRHHQR